jgi:sugar porter (SP) family MFS transporter
MGAAMGSMQGNTQTYVSEVTPVEIRGFALSLFQFWIILGSLLAACVLQGTTSIDGPWSWKAAIVTQVGPAALCLLIFIPFVPESPYYLVQKGQLDRARKAVQKLRSSEAGFDPEEEVRTMKATLDHERQQRAEAKQPSYLECFQGTDLRRTLVACLPVVMQLFMGYPLCGNYLAYFLSMSGIDDAFLITVISILCSLVSAGIAFVLIERVGRRPQILIGVYGMLVCLLIVGLLGFFGRGELWNNRALSAFCIIWAVFYYMSVGAVGWTIVGEISSSRLRAKTTSLAAISSSIFNMGWSIAIPYLVNAEEANLGPKTGLIFLGFGVFLGVAAFVSIPETKGKTFEELDNLFAARVSARKF